MQRYPEYTEVIAGAIQNCGIQDVIESLEREDYSSIWHALSSKARKFIEEEKNSEGKLLWLLADACSMSLKPSSKAEPFQPSMIMNGKRSALVEDFTADDIKLFSEILPEIADPHIAARISDILWLVVNPREASYATAAIESYSQISITDIGSIDCWDRALQLCFMTKNKHQIATLEAFVIERFMSLHVDDHGLALNVYNNLIKRHRLGKERFTDITTQLESIGIAFNEMGELHYARSYFYAATDAYSKLQNGTKKVEMMVLQAEAWEKEALANLASKTPSSLIAISHYGSAIQKYREVPKNKRDEYQIDERIKTLRKKLFEEGEKVHEEMSVVETPGVDISDIIGLSREFVSGKRSVTDALIALSNVHRPAEKEKIREEAKECIVRYPLASMLLGGGTHFSRDGRVIANTPSADFSWSADNEPLIWFKMVENYSMNIGLVVQGAITPALEVLHQEHRIRESDFQFIVNQSPVIPQDRRHLFTKALFFGYDFDFSTSLHLLVPQVENLVRVHLKLRGATTTSLDRNGINNELGLSALVDIPETKDIFGDDLTFELKALFCDSIGANLRNELAHGLISYYPSQSYYSIYAWWLLLRIVVNTYLMNLENQSLEKTE